MTGASLYMLDTLTVAYAVSGRSPAARTAIDEQIKRSTVAISVVTEAEILYGLARKPEATRLRAAMETLFTAIAILPWDSAAARTYATARARMSAAGKALSPMDMLIAAHVLALGAILVTGDKAFSQIGALHSTENWATDL
jgi:tRNA(fMet)-specific endonuclease VapC